VHYTSQVILGEFPQFESPLQDFFSAQLRGVNQFSYLTALRHLPLTYLNFRQREVSTWHRPNFGVFPGNFKSFI
jgi:hypothetical protein